MNEELRRQLIALGMPAAAGEAEAWVFLSALKSPPPVRLSMPMALAAGGLTIDRKAGTIDGVSVITRGPAEGHGFEIDDTMLRQVCDQINAQPKGVKMRLGHPTLFGGDAVGTVTGRLSAAQVIGDRVRAKATVSNYAASSPRGNLRDYLLDVAEGDPEVIGLSIVFDAAPFEPRKDANTGITMPPLGRSKAMLAADWVDWPAANPAGLLSRGAAKDTQPIAQSVSQGVITMPFQNSEVQRVIQETRREFLGYEHGQTLPAMLASLGDRQFGQAISDAILLRAGMTPPEENARGQILLESPEHFARYGWGKVKRRQVHQDDACMQIKHLSLVDLARLCLIKLGVYRVDLMHGWQLAKLAFDRPELCRRLSRDRGHGVGDTWIELAMGGGASTADFPNLMGDAMGRAIRMAYIESPVSWSAWARRGTTKDFRPAKRIQMSNFGDLHNGPEGRDPEIVTIKESEEKFTLAKYEGAWRQTWESVVDDDLNIFTRIPQAGAAAARRKEQDLAFGVLTTNATMADGIALFHASHGNLISGGSAISVASLGVGSAKMQRQVGIGGEALNLVPAALIVPAELKAVAVQAARAQNGPGTAAGEGADPDIAQNIVPIAEARLSNTSTTAWYLAASINQIDTVEVCFLESEQLPFYELQVEPNGSRLHYIRHSAAAAAIDYRGLVCHAGA